MYVIRMDERVHGNKAPAYAGYPVGYTFTSNIDQAATWGEDEKAKAEQIAPLIGGKPVLFAMVAGIMLEVVSAERAKEIWDARLPMGEWRKDAYSVEEDRYICAVWEQMPGHTSWADALINIMMGRA